MRTISCVICAYNEVDRIKNILDVVVGHPLLSQVIVVNDGSTDATEALLTTYPSVTALSYSPNRGKTYALGYGIGSTTGDLIMLLDADLTGITAEDVSALAQPVLAGTSDISLSLRSNSLRLYQWLGIDYVTGERVIPRGLATEFMKKSKLLPRWGGEVYMNDLILRENCTITVVKWDAVLNIRKYAKIGRVEGFTEELRMIRDAFTVFPFFTTLSQMTRMRSRIVRKK